MITTMLRRFGIFLILVGLITLILTFPLREIEKSSMALLCIGTPMVILGYLLWSRNRDRTPAARFRLIRKLAAKKKTENEPEESQK